MSTRNAKIGSLEGQWIDRSAKSSRGGKLALQACVYRYSRPQTALFRHRRVGRLRLGFFQSARLASANFLSAAAFSAAARSTAARARATISSGDSAFAATLAGDGFGASLPDIRSYINPNTASAGAA